MSEKLEVGSFLAAFLSTTLVMTKRQTLMFSIAGLQSNKTSLLEFETRGPCRGMIRLLLRLLLDLIHREPQSTSVRIFSTRPSGLK